MFPPRGFGVLERNLHVCYYRRKSRFCNNSYSHYSQFCKIFHYAEFRHPRIVPHIHNITSTIVKCCSPGFVAMYLQQSKPAAVGVSRYHHMRCSSMYFWYKKTHNRIYLTIPLANSCHLLLLQTGGYVGGLLLPALLLCPSLCPSRWQRDDIAEKS